MKNGYAVKILTGSEKQNTTQKNTLWLSLYQLREENVLNLKQKIAEPNVVLLSLSALPPSRLFSSHLFVQLQLLCLPFSRFNCNILAFHSFVLSVPVNIKLLIHLRLINHLKFQSQPGLPENPMLLSSAVVTFNQLDVSAHLLLSSRYLSILVLSCMKKTW